MKKRDDQLQQVIWVTDHISPPSGLANVQLQKISARSEARFDEKFETNVPAVALFSFQNPQSISRSQLNSFRRQFPHVARILVLNENEDLAPLVNLLQPHRVVAKDFNDWDSMSAEGLELSTKSVEQQRVLQEVKSRNRQLTDMKEFLDAKMEDRTRTLDQSTVATEIQVSRLRSLVRFIKELSSVLEVQDLLHLLRKELKNFHRVKEPLLALPVEKGRPKIYFFQGSQVQSKTVEKMWNSSLRLRINDREDRQYLADQFGRPFAKVIAVPLAGHKSSAKAGVNLNSALLILEHSLADSEIDEFLEFTSHRLQPLSIALDRLLLESDLRVSSLLWEGTFDGLMDPIAIVDIDSNLLRYNQAFYVRFISEEDRSQKLLRECRVEQAFKESTVRVTTLAFQQHVYEVRAYPITFVGQSTATTLVVHWVDVTKSKSLQSRLIQHEKMAAIGHLAGNIAHELNNPLTGIRSLSQLLVSEMTPGSQIHSDMLEVEKAAERCQIIIKDLLEFSRNEVEEIVKIVDFNDVIRRTLPMLKTAMRELSCDVQLSEQPILIRVAPQLMQQVVFNLVNNACQATKSPGQVSVVTRVEKGVAHLQISDSGVGMSPEVKARIFEPFFTTKGRGQGTGLGLNMSLNIVKRFDGDIHVESELGKGSCFTVSLPVAGNSQ